jgi:hypothetical protein
VEFDGVAVVVSGAVDAVLGVGLVGELVEFAAVQHERRVLAVDADVLVAPAV